MGDTPDWEEIDVEEQLTDDDHSLDGSLTDFGYESRPGTFSKTLNGKERPKKRDADARSEPAGDPEGVSLSTSLLQQHLNRAVEPPHPLQAGGVGDGHTGVDDSIRDQEPTEAVQSVLRDESASGPSRVESLQNRRWGVKGSACIHGWWQDIGVLQKTVIILTLLLLVVVALLAVKFAQKEISCPEGWLWHDGHCYFFSTETKYWELCKTFCSTHGARLAIIKDKHHLKIINHFKADEEYWIGLRRRGEAAWFWEDGSMFDNDTIAMVEDVSSLDCAYLNTNKIGLLDCDTSRHWICVKKWN